MGTLLRRRKTEGVYNRYSKTLGNKCQFCEFNLDVDQVIAESSHFWIVENIFGYDLWDSSEVESHLMLVPKRHIVALTELNAAEQKDFFRQLKPYEESHYSIYARAPANKRKSVVHQHTHLIKIDNKVKKLVFYLKKPHILLMK